MCLPAYPPAPPVQVLKIQRLLEGERQRSAELAEMLGDMTRKYEAMVRLR